MKWCSDMDENIGPGQAVPSTLATTIEYSCARVHPKDLEEAKTRKKKAKAPSIKEKEVESFLMKRLKKKFGRTVSKVMVRSVDTLEGVRGGGAQFFKRIGQKAPGSVYAIIVQIKGLPTTRMLGYLVRNDVVANDLPKSMWAYQKAIVGKNFTVLANKGTLRMLSSGKK